MKRFFIMTNRSKDPDLVETTKIKDYLTSKGAHCGVAEFVKVLSAGSGKCRYSCEVPDDTDICIVLGGDGTMLEAAANVLDKDIPIIGVNLGKLGYLAEVEMSTYETAMDKLIAGEYEIEERMMLKAVFRQGEDEDKVFYALNDIVVRSSLLQVSSFNIYVNDMPLTKYTADGIILSTPTGSTGYNMSAGGPIVDPQAQLLLLTPICPHTINSRSIVLPQKDIVTVEIDKERENMKGLEAAMDGGAPRAMRSGDKIDMSVADKVTRIVKLSSESFLNTLREKLV